MHYDVAPMEGVTDRIYRNAHRQLFGGADLYWMPFWSPTQEHVLTERVRRDILPEYNRDTPVLPQILTKSVPDFLWAAGELAAMGYEEVNLNLGCPSGTVTAKGKGAGLLGDLSALERLLDGIFEKTPIRVSVKTRLGVADPEEFGPLLQLYNRYPLARLAVHARVLRDQYRLPVRPEGFDAALRGSRCPVTCNGDLKTLDDCRRFVAAHPTAAALMIGRGLLADPALLRRARGGPPAGREELRAFSRTLYEDYCRAFGGPKNALPRMKAHWCSLVLLLEDSGKYAKALRKAGEPERFLALTDEALDRLPLRTGAAVNW